MAKRWSLALGIFAACLATPALADRSTAQFTSITVFGDSLVDAGNFFTLKTSNVPDPVPAYFLNDPKLGYYEGRFTNGYDYPDLLSMDLFGVPTTSSLSGGNNFAYGGARIVNAVEDNIPDLQAQLDTFESSGRVVDSNGLYILNFGANDVFAAEGELPVSGIGSYPDIDSYLQAAADQYAVGVQALNDLGVRNIFMTDFPNAVDPLTAQANTYLESALSKLNLDPATSLMVYSLSNFNLRVLSNPESFGLPPQRLDTSCIAAGAQSTDCAGIFSFDGVHPTAAIQAAGYKDINRLFGLASTIPEPTTWMMMCIGFGTIGAALRRRRAMTVPASRLQPA